MIDRRYIGNHGYIGDTSKISTLNEKKSLKIGKKLNYYK